MINSNSSGVVDPGFEAAVHHVRASQQEEEGMQPVFLSPSLWPSQAPYSVPKLLRAVPIPSTS